MKNFDDFEIKDEGLDLIIRAKEEEKMLTNSIEKTEFAKRMDEVKLAVLDDAHKTDAEFVDTVKKNLKKSAIISTEVEQEKQELEKQQVKVASKILDRTEKQTEHATVEDVWANKQNKRQFYYDGVKPVMTFVGILEPMNIGVLWFLTVILMPFFLIDKIMKATLGALIMGASDENRPKLARGMLWTVFAVASATLLVFCILLFLQWQGVKIFR